MLVEQRSPRAFAFAERPVVQAFEQFGDGLIEFGDSAKNLRCRSAAKYPSLHDAERHFQLWLCPAVYSGRAGMTAMP